MYGRLNNASSERHKGLVDDVNNVKILAVIQEPGYEKRYVIKANWHGCTNPRIKYYAQHAEYLDPSLPNADEDLFEAYWISGDVFNKTWEDYKTNKQAARMLSSEY